MKIQISIFWNNKWIIEIKDKERQKQVVECCECESSTYHYVWDCCERDDDDGEKEKKKE